MSFKTFESFNVFTDLIQGFTYRNGGVVELPFGNQHMGILSCHYRDEAWENVKHLIGSLSLKRNIEAFVCTEQVHKDDLVNFKVASQSPVMRDGLPLYVQSETDGVFTSERNTLLMTFYADCTPVYFYDPKKKACGMVHSGWKGTALKIAVKGVKFMEAEFDSAIEDLVVVLGPAAGKCCYEVDRLVYNAFPDHADCFEPTVPDHYLMDLKRIIQKDLLRSGLTESQIEVSPDCTLCQREDYFSYRKENGNTGRMAAFMMLV